MAPANDQLPEGTDTIIEGAGVTTDDVTGDVDGDALEAPTLSSAGATGSANASGGADRGPQGATHGDEQATTSGGAGSGGTAAGGGAFYDRIDELRGQATDKARDFAQAGKDRATAALDNLVRTIEDAASEIDDKLGSQYGDYARRAAEGVGNFSGSFRDKDVDDLFNDARALIQKSPAIAVGAAAAIGFVVARLARAGLPENATSDAPKA